MGHLSKESMRRKSYGLSHYRARIKRVKTMKWQDFQEQRRRIFKNRKKEKLTHETTLFRIPTVKIGNGGGRRFRLKDPCTSDVISANVSWQDE